MKKKEREQKRLEKKKKFEENLEIIEYEKK